MQFQKQKYSKLADILEKKQGVLFCGAGISLEPPAGLPDWHNLRDSTIKAVVSRDTFLQQYQDTLIHMDMLEQPGKKGLTPEYVASVIALSSKNYFECFSALKKGEPNLNHRYIAKIAKEGYLKFIITTNFDIFIEKALVKENIPFIVYKSDDDFKSARLDDNEHVHLFKLHGCIDYPETITVTVEQETRGLSTSKQGLLNSLLLQYYFIFWGYSGADLKINLDYLRMVSMTQQAKGFIWNFYSKTEDINANVKELVSIYKDKAEIVTGRLPDIFNDFISPDDQIRSEVFSEEQRNLLQHERDKELNEGLRLWANQSLSKHAAFHIVARLLKHSGNVSEAKECYLQLIPMINDTDRDLYCSACNELGYIYKLQGDYNTAISYFEKIKTVANKYQDKSLLILSYNSLGGIYLVWNHVGKALDCYESAKKIAFKNKDYRGLAFAYSKLGLINKKQRKIQQSLDYFEKAKKLCLEIGDKIGHAINLDNIGKIYRSQGRYSEALNCFEEAKKITISMGDKQGLAVRLTSIATIYEKNKQLEQALGYYQEAQQIARELGDKNGIMMHCRNIAHIYEKQNQIQEAIRMYQESYEYSKELKQKKHMLHTMDKISYLKQKERKQR